MKTRASVKAKCYTAKFQPGSPENYLYTTSELTTLREDHFEVGKLDFEVTS